MVPFWLRKHPAEKIINYTDRGLTVAWEQNGNRRIYSYTVRAYKTSPVNISAYNATGKKIKVKK
ncbi:MAG: hypothetical protein FWD65_02380 [Coriobacteriia bacterium]|nr:hypothetical protein [Coriobacteriia bacterium]